MAESTSGDDDNVFAQLSMTVIEAAALRPAIADLLRLIPATWAEFDFDRLTNLQERALFLLTAAGMVERRGWIRTTIANHPTCFELQFQATGEGGFNKALERATAVEFQTWGDTWRKWREGETRGVSPFHVQSLKPQEWRLRDQGEFARDELNRATSNADLATVLDFVLKRGLYGPGYWLRRGSAGQPLTADDKRTIEKELAAGRDLAHLSRPPVVGSGQLLDIREIEKPSLPQAVALTNWSEGASEFANAFVKSLGPMFEAANKASQGAAPKAETENAQSTSPTSISSPPTTPTPFRDGVVVFMPDRVLLCGVDICNGPRSQTRRKVLELLGAKRSDGKFESYSGGQLAEKVGLTGTENTAAGVIRDLRNGIAKALLEGANISCGRQDVILSRGPGYRLSEKLSVQFGADETARTDQDNSASTHGSGDPDRDPNDADPDDPDRGTSASKKREEWILHRMAEGKQLRALHVAEHFNCSIPTAKRDLQALKRDGRIEFVGSTRTGFYRLRQPPKSNQ